MTMVPTAFMALGSISVSAPPSPQITTTRPLLGSYWAPSASFSVGIEANSLPSTALMIRAVLSPLLVVTIRSVPGTGTTACRRSPWAKAGLILPVSASMATTTV